MYRIGIDAHAIGERLTGNETYIVNIIDGLSKIDSGNDFVLFLSNQEEAIKLRSQYPDMETAIMQPSWPPVRIPVVMPFLSWKHKIDMLHVQYAGPPFIHVPMVVSIHDISYEIYPQFFSKKEIFQFKTTIPLTARTAKKIITISECSKRDLINIYGLPEEKIVVTYLGVNQIFAPRQLDDYDRSILKKYGISGKYILAVGNLQPRKNLVRLTDAYTRLRNSRPDLNQKLVIVGKKAWKSSPILDFAQKSRWIDDIIFTGYVPEQQLPIIYSHADVFVYPSIYEGFGLPPLEAMACGTPVIVSDRASLPEVVGDAGIKVNPFDVDSLAASVAAILLEPDISTRLSRVGRDRASAFTWSKCVKKTLSIFEAVCKENKSRNVT